MLQAKELDRNGNMLVAKATSINKSAIWQDQRELNSEMADNAVERDSQAGVGRLLQSLHKPQTAQALEHVPAFATVAVSHCSTMFMPLRKHSGRLPCYGNSRGMPS